MKTNMFIFVRPLIGPFFNGKTATFLSKRNRRACNLYIYCGWWWCLQGNTNKTKKPLRAKMAADRALAEFLGQPFEAEAPLADFERLFAAKYQCVQCAAVLSPPNPPAVAAGRPRCATSTTPCCRSGRRCAGVSRPTSPPGIAPAA